MTHLAGKPREALGTTRRRLPATLLLPAALGACMQKANFNYAGSCDPFYVALTTAQQNLSDLSQYRGRPAAAARALAQFEFILAEIQDQAAQVEMPTSAWSLIQGGDQQLRSALGVAPGTPPRTVSTTLRRFASAWSAGQRDAAMAALNQPFFTLGPQRTFAVLNNLPPLPDIESSAASLDRAAASMSDFSRPLRL